MNYYGPRAVLRDGADADNYEEADVGGYFYTRKHGSGESGLVRAVGYCGGLPTRPEEVDGDHDSGVLRRGFLEEEWDRIEEAGTEDKYHDDPHDTEEEACECYKEYLLDFYLVFRDPDPGEAGVLKTCQEGGCTVMTPVRTAVVDHPRGPGFNLCTEHRDRETVEGLFKVGESFGTR